MNSKIPRSRRDIKSFSGAETVRVQLPYPKAGETLQVEFPRYGLTVLVERREEETQEQLRARYCVTAPMGEGDNRTHATRLGTGTARPKKMGVTLCTEEAVQSKASGIRLQGLELESVTCSRCRAALARDGVDIATKEGNGS